MRYIQPNIIVPGDRPDRIVARSAELVATTKTRAIWRAGFLADSDAAVAYGVCCLEFQWILATTRGKILTQFSGFASGLPGRFRKILI